MKKNIGRGLAGFIIIVIGTYFLGPRVNYEPVSNMPLSKTFAINELNNIVSNMDANVPHLKEDNEARIVWADSIPAITKYSLVYLHGFSASQGEGYPLHINLADSLGANLYLPRLPEHGVDYLDAMKDLTPAMLVESAKEAIAIGKSIGEKLILIGCSTGGTLAIYLTAGDPEVDALILLSPNIKVKNGSTKLLTGPWGKQLAYTMAGTHRKGGRPQQYWSHQYHMNGVIAMQSLLEQTMQPEVFDDIRVPVYCGYYYKNEEVQDPTVSVAAMLEFQKDLEVPVEDVEFEAFENGEHVLGSVYKNENWKEVQDEVWDFIKREILAE